MCTFMPGEILAFGEIGKLDAVIADAQWGNVQKFPLHPEAQGVPPDERFLGRAIYRISGIPRGYEVAAVSQLSGQLGASIKKGAAVVELNHRLPLAGKGGANLKLSGPARKWADLVSRTFFDVSSPQGTIAFIDSGVNPSVLGTSRSVESYDYTNPDVPPTRPTRDHDQHLHGTIVAKVLDEALHPNVKLVSAKLGDDDDQVTTLRLCRVFSDVVVRTQPEVVNISLAPSDDWVKCNKCGEQMEVVGFQSEILKRLVQLACPAIVVMAAGNAGQASNFGRFGADDCPLVLAMALGSHGERTQYTNSPVGAFASEQAAAAFGGDDPDLAGGVGMTDSRADVGTSFAAPFVSAMAFALNAKEPVKAGENAEARVRRIRRALREHLMHRRLLLVRDW